jgi:hypothetical protein
MPTLPLARHAIDNLLQPAHVALNGKEKPAGDVMFALS